MSNNGDLKKEGPPTLFNSQSETDEAGHTRILASLEGRVGPGGKPPKRSGRRYGIAAVVGVLAAGVGTWIVLNPSSDQGTLPVAEHAAPAAPAATQQAAAGPAQPAAAAPANPSAAASESVAAPAATIVNVTPNDEHAADKPSKDAQTAKAVADAPAKDAHTETTAQHAATAKSGDTEQAKAETAKLVAKSTGALTNTSTNTSVKAAPVTKAKAQAAVKSGKNRKSGLSPDDPDADLLAALLAPQNANKPATQPNSKGQ